MYENGESVSENGFSVSQTDPSFNPNNFSMGIELQQQLGLNIDHLSHTQFIQEMGHDLNKPLPYDDQQNWGNEMTYSSFSTQNLNPINAQNGQQLNFNNSSLPGFMSLYPPSLLAKPSFPVPFLNQPVNLENMLPTGEQLGPNIVYESPDLFHDSLGNVSSLIGGMDERIGWEYEIGERGNRVGYRGKGTTKTKEKIRREQVNGKFQALRSLVPNPTKNDKASVIADAIDYIKELLRTKSELKILVDMKRRERERNKRQKKAQDAGNHEGGNIKPEADEPYNNSGSSSLRSSWLQRKSREAEVDVRIVDDEVTIKLAQKKKANCLLIVSKVLDELELDIHHVAGGLVGDNFSFLFNTKICEGSCVYASAIANKIIEVVDKQYATIQPGSNF